MKQLWEATLTFTNWDRTKEQPYRLFLFLHTLCWTLPGLLLAMAVCLIIRPEWNCVVTAIVLAAGIPGVSVGLMGGSLFLMRLDS